MRVGYHFVKTWLWQTKHCCKFYYSKIRHFHPKVYKLSKAKFSQFDRTRGDKNQIFHTLDPMISQAQFQSLVTMYRAHSQCIMDFVNKFSFVEIPNLFKHFWRELPNHIFCFIGHKSIVTYIGVCDKILYTTILKAILPTPLQVSKTIVTIKVHIFWEGHKILRNLHIIFDWHYTGQK